MNKDERFTYARSGVDIPLAELAKKALIQQLRFRRKEGVGAPLESTKLHYASLLDFGESYLALCTDGVGTKLLIADELQRWNTVGIDCVAMNVNDAICLGAEPLAMVDYIALKKPDVSLCEQLGKGLNEGARQANISIVGGETAVVPEIVNSFDLAGTCLGMVRKDQIVDGRNIKMGDAIIGIRSSGIHSNGLTLARKIVANAGKSLKDPLPGTESTIGDELLRPTAIYVKPILALLKEFHRDISTSPIHGLAHMTGSGMRKIERICAEMELGFPIKKPMEPQPIFKYLQELGNVTTKEMYNTFNMGMGFCVIVEDRMKEEILGFLQKKQKLDCQIVGNIGPIDKSTHSTTLSQEGAYDVHLTERTVVTIPHN